VPSSILNAVLVSFVMVSPALAGRPVYRDLSFAEAQAQAEWIVEVRKVPMPQGGKSSECEMADERFEVLKVLKPPLEKPSRELFRGKIIFVRAHNWRIYQSAKGERLPSYKAVRLVAQGNGIAIGKVGKILLVNVSSGCGEYVADGASFDGTEAGVNWEL
jgi:hypothetical protein